MNEPGPPKAIDALHAELLGDVAVLVKHVEDLKQTLPLLSESTRKESAAITQHLADSFEEFQQSSISLVGYIKSKQLETMSDVQAAHGSMVEGARKSLQGFERVQWLIAGLVGCNVLLTTVLLAVLFLKR